MFSKRRQFCKFKSASSAVLLMSSNPNDFNPCFDFQEVNDVLQRVSGESQPVPLWRTASTEDLDNIKEKEFPLFYSFRLNLKVTVSQVGFVLNSRCSMSKHQTHCVNAFEISRGELKIRRTVKYFGELRSVWRCDETLSDYQIVVFI